MTYKTKAISLISVIASILLLMGSLSAKTEMNGVPQNIGFDDVAFKSFTEKKCRDCHGEVVNKHHATKVAKAGKCTKCHKVAIDKKLSKVVLDRNCMSCHLESPHHVTEAAQKNNCISCHKKGIAKFSKIVPKYNLSIITPKSTSCLNCHKAAKVGEMAVSGPKDTHHGTGLKKCSLCHVKGKEKEGEIRPCEKCHSLTSLHNIGPHAKQENCTGCHLPGNSTSTEAKTNIIGK